MKTSAVAQLKGASKVAVDATRAVTDIVEAMHLTIGGGPAVLGQPLARVTSWLTRPAYGAVRGVTGLVGSGLDAALGRLEPLLTAPGVEKGALLSALNGVIGDYLAHTDNPLALDMAWRLAGAPVELVRPLVANKRVAVLIHGSSMNDEQWLRAGHDHGAFLERELGLVPLYLRYNSGLHISQNGALLAAKLNELDEASALVLIGHSMGGLVARSALAQGAAPSKVTHLVTLGTPHHGASLERLGNVADLLLTVSRYSAPLAKLGRLRSAGVTDLRYGNVLHEHWQNHNRFERAPDRRTPVPLPRGVSCLAIAGTTSTALGTPLKSDGLVSVDSALGHHARDDQRLAFETFIATGTSHLDLLSSAAVAEELLEWLR